MGVPGGALGGCLAGDHWSPSPVLLLLISAEMSPDESSEHTDLPEDGGLEDSGNRSDASEGGGVEAGQHQAREADGQQAL